MLLATFFAQADPASADADERLAGLVGIEYRRFASFDGVPRPSRGMGRIYLDDVAGHQPVEERAQRGEVLLYCWRRAACSSFLIDHVEKTPTENQLEFGRLSVPAMQ
jgi:hypothetical protein